MRMSSSTAVFALGMILTLGAVGGVETSMTYMELALSILVAIVGLNLAYIGVLGLKTVDRTGG